MKFKAAFTDRGLRALEKGFVPTLEKFGKTCQLLLGPVDVYLIQTGVNTDGVHVTARLSREVLFTAGSFVISSRSNDQIAFSFEIANLLRVLRSASANGADFLEMRLTMRSGAADTAPRPFLTFTSRGDSLHIVHDLPISAPYKASEIDRLVQELNRTESLCTYYVDIQPEVSRLQAVVDKLKSLGDTALLAITNGGDMHVQVQDSTVELGIELRRLPVLPQDEAEKAQPLSGQSAEARLREVQAAGDAAVVSVQLKHIARSLQVSQLTQPQQLLCGIGANNGHVHFMFVYKDPFSDEAFDDKISLSYKLPVRDDT